MAENTSPWWQHGIIYQVYPRSFKDSNGDGIGDLPGITSKLDYLRWLGVDALWLSPIYPSPMADFGYDISHYTDVHPLFGTLQDLDTLLEQAHQRGLKLLLDFVPNHTSDEHPWFKDEHFRNNPLNPLWKPGDPAHTRMIEHYIVDQPDMHGIMQEMRTLTEEYDRRVLIGELYLPLERLMPYYGEQFDEIHLPFNFQFVNLPTWETHTIRQAVEDYEAALPEGAWPNWVLGNHDRTRIATRVGREQARLTQMLLLTLRGTPTCYYGEELGMQNVALARELIQDPAGKEDAEKSRDPVRTPMQWDSSPNAGFCPPDATPWLPLAKDYQQFNVAVERDDPHSLLTLTRRLIALRRATPALALGDYRAVEGVHDGCYVYLRQSGSQQYLIALNFSEQEQTLTLPAMGNGHTGRIVLSTYLDREEVSDLAHLRLRANEGVVMECVPM